MYPAALASHFRRTPAVARFAVYALIVAACEILGLEGIFLHYGQGWANPAMFGAAMLFPIGAAYAVVLIRDHRDEFDKLFFIVGFPLLLGFALFLMPSNVPDEPTHIQRLFDNRQGLEYILVPAQLNERLFSSWVTSYADMHDLLQASFDYTNLVPSDWCASSYSVVNYLIPSLVVSAGKYLGLNAWLLIYGARIANMLMFLLCGCWALRAIPFGKAFLLVFLLNPLMLQQEASCSADVLCNIAVVGFIAQTVAMRFDERPFLPLSQWAILFFFLALLALCKYAYLPIALIGFCLVKKIRTKWIRRGIAIGFPLIMVAGIAYISFSGYASAIQYMVEMLLNPADFLELLGATIIHATPVLLRQYAGGQLGWPMLNEMGGEFPIPNVWILTIVIMAIAIPHAAAEYRKAGFAIWESALFTGTALLSALIIFIALAGSIMSVAQAPLGYVSWIQGRYFFATGLLLALVLASLFLQRDSIRSTVEHIRPWMFPVISSAVGGYTLYIIITTFA